MLTFAGIHGASYYAQKIMFVPQKVADSSTSNRKLHTFVVDPCTLPGDSRQIPVKCLVFQELLAGKPTSSCVHYLLGLTATLS